MWSCEHHADRHDRAVVEVAWVVEGAAGSALMQLYAARPGSGSDDGSGPDDGSGDDPDDGSDPAPPTPSARIAAAARCCPGK